MATFDEQMDAIGAQYKSDYFEFKKLCQEVFERFYPALTPDDIEGALKMHTAFSEHQIEIIQSFYETTSYSRTARELQLNPRNAQAQVRHAVLRALQRLPEQSPLHTALQMAYRHRNIREIPDV